MPRIAYTVPGATSAAFTPIPANDGRNLGPWMTKDNVSGQPGTMAVPTGLTDFGEAGLLANGVSIRGGGAGYASGSGTMRRSAWFPSLYWQRSLSQSTLTVTGQGPSVWSDNQMPVPAADPIGRAAVLAKPPAFLGQRQLAQPPGPKAPARWANWIPRLNYGS